MKRSAIRAFHVDARWHAEALELSAGGLTIREIADRLDRPLSTVAGVVNKTTRKRPCARCGVMFVGQSEHKNYAQRFCSGTCAKAAQSERLRQDWPTLEEMRRLVYVEKLSDSKIGAIYGHSYEWARRVRNVYGFKALPKPPHREVKHGRYIGADKWGVTQKGEDRCRACGARGGGDTLFGRLHLHHAIPRSMCRATKTDLRNGIPLCSACHRGWHDRRVTIFRDVFTVAEWEFLSSVQLTGQLVGPWLDANYPSRGLPLRGMCGRAHGQEAA